MLLGGEIFILIFFLSYISICANFICVKWDRKNRIDRQFRLTVKEYLEHNYYICVLRSTLVLVQIQHVCGICRVRSLIATDQIIIRVILILITEILERQLHVSMEVPCVKLWLNKKSIVFIRQRKISEINIANGKRCCHEATASQMALSSS